HNLVAGASFYRIDVNEELGSFKSSFAEDQDTVYLYSNVTWPRNTTWTVGLSYDRYEERQHKLVDQVSPKLGLQWQLTENLRLRAAALRTAKPALVADQTIEPTQVAGFNQFFDDINGTKTELYGLGLDARLGSTLYAGVEGSRRALEAPLFVPPIAEFETQDWREALLRAYLYWAPHANWAVSTEYQLDKFKIATTETIFPLPVDVPTRVQTTSIPIVMRYFNRYGFFGALGTRYVHQDVDLSPASMFEQDSDDFFLLDAAIGYRLPKRLGILSMEVKNLLDEQFLFQDDSFRSSIARLPSMGPGRILLARMTFNWD
ncbi:MAG: TonB-dependent receptor, partial [Gammaproteobacteria bacterium]